MNRKVAFACFALFVGVVNAFEVDFNESTFTGGIPTGWELATKYTTTPTQFFASPQQVDGKTVLTMNFYSATAGSRIIYCTTPITDAACDNISVSMPIYLKKAQTGAKVDWIQVVASTNGFDTVIEIGDRIPLQELDRLEDGWVTNKISSYIEGISGHEILIGLKATAAGSSGKYGYVGGLKAEFVASATPDEVGFVVSGEVGNLVAAETLAPGMDDARVCVSLKVLPEDSISSTNVYAIVTRNGAIATNKLTCVGGTSYVGEPLTPTLDAGEELSVSVITEYTSYSLPVLGDVIDGVAYEYAENAWSGVVAKKGSVWINEAVLDETGFAVEFAGTTNRVMTTGWTLSVSNETSETVLQIAEVLDFTTNMVNGVIGLDVRRYSAESLLNGTNVIKLINSRGICESEVEVVKEGERLSCGMSGIAIWNEAKEYSYDWSGTADGVFEWGVCESPTIGTVNDGQGFRVHFCTTISISTKTATGAPLPYATVSLIAENIENYAESTVFITNVTTSAEGTAELLLSGFSCATNKVNVNCEASAFGWTANSEESSFDVFLAEDASNVLNVIMSRAPACDDCDSLKSYWGQNSNLKWSVNTQGTRKSLSMNLYNAAVGTNSVMQCANNLSADGKKYVAVSFEFRNTVNSNMSRYNELCFSFGTNSTWSGSVFDAVVLSNKRAEYANNEWYPYTVIVELPEGFEESELWLRLISRTKGGVSNAYLYLDNLCIAFQDIAVPTNMERSVEVPASGESIDIDLDVLPQTADEVKEVSADLHFVLNGVTNVVPFAFEEGVYTNSVGLVDVDGVMTAVATNLTVSADRLIEEALGGWPLLAGDEVTYFAAVHYNSDNGATAPDELYETRYFPDNSTTSNIDERAYWIVEGDYGVNTNLEAYSFTVAGPALSKFGEVVPTTEGVRFNLHGFSTNDISDLSVNIKATGSDATVTNLYPFADLGLDTNAQRRVTGTCELGSGLAANTEYTVTIAGTDAHGNPIEQGTFTFWTLPEAPTVKIEGISTSTVRLTARGNAAGYKVPGWTPSASDADTWTKDGGSPNQMFEATVCALNADGGESAPTVTNGYTLAAVATKAPAIEKIASTVKVGATNYVASADGNPDATEYAVRVTTSSTEGEAFVATNGVTVWKPLSAWADDWVTVGVPTIDLAATNTFSFVSRNFGLQESDAGQATTNCFFEMNAGFNSDDTGQTADGSVNVSLVFFDPAQSADAEADVEYKIGNGPWTPLTSFNVPFAEQNAATNFSWDAWTAVGQTPGNYEYQLQAKVSAGNRASEWAPFSGTLDFTPPTVALTSATPAHFNAASSPMVVTATFDEDVTGLTAAGLTVVNGTAAVSGSGKVWTITVTPAADGDVSVAVNANAATDAAGNGNMASETLTRTYDGTAPTVALTSATPAHFNAAGSPMVVTATFDEDVTGLTAAGLTVVNGTASVSGSGKVWTITVTPSAEGDVSVAVNADAAMDAAGNGNTASATLTRKYDTTAPTVELTSATPACFNAASSPMVVTATFDEDVTGLTAAGLTVVNGTASVSGSGKVWTITVTPAADGDVSVAVNANAATDAAGNGNTASAALTRKYDATQPTVALTSSTPAHFNEASSPMVVTATFNEDVTGLTVAGLTVVNGTASVSGSGKVWTITVTPAADGDVSVAVNANAATDAAGNGNTASATLTRKYDTTKPTVALASATPMNFNEASSPMVVTATFSEDVTGLAVAGLTVVNGTASVSGSGKVWTITVTPSADGDVSVAVNANAATDAAGNGNTASAALTRKYDTTKPTVALASATPMNFNEASSPMVVTATFSEDVTGLTAAGLTVVNGTASVSGSGKVWTITVTPAADGDVSVAVNANAATDAAGNGNTASATLTRKYDTTKPTVALTSATPADFNEASSPMVVTATFSEDVTGLTAAGLTVVNGTASVSGSGKVWTITVMPSADGDVSVAVNADAATDAADNGNTASATLTRTYDGTAPTVALTSATPEHFNAAGSPMVVTATFDEDVTGLTTAGLTVVNGTASVSGSGKVWTITVTPTPDKVVSVAVNANAATDAAGNGNVASATLTRTYDNTPPTNLEISGTPANGVVTTNRVIDLTATATDNLTPQDKISYRWTLNNEAAATSAALDGTAIEGTNTASVIATDEAGNDSVAATRWWVVDTQAPEWEKENALVGLPVEGSVTNSTAFAFTASATDATAITYHWSLNGTNVTGVTGATFGDAAATAAALAVVEGTNTVSVYATDAAGNENAPTNRTWVVDTIAPTPPEISGTPANGALTNLTNYALSALSEDMTAITYHWMLTTPNGASETSETNGTLVGTATVDGEYTVRVYATDEAANVSRTNTWSWVLDTQAPEVVIAGTPANGTTTADKDVSLTATATDNVTATNDIVFSWTLKNGAATLATSTDSTLEGADMARQGTNTVCLLAWDKAGNIATNTWSWTVDTNALSKLELSGFPADGTLTNSTKYGFTATVDGANADTRYHWALFRTNETSATGWEVVTNDTSHSSAFAGFVAQDGLHMVSVYATGKGSISSPTNLWLWTVDTTPPTTPVISGTPANGALTNLANYTLSALSEDMTVTTYHWTLEGTNGTIEASGTDGVFAGTVIDGAYTARVFATDEVGNVSKTNAWSWTVDTVPPTVEIGVVAQNDSGTVTFTFSEPITNFGEDAVTSVGWSKVPGSLEHPSQSETNDVYTMSFIKSPGYITVQIKAGVVTDRAGNGNLASEVMIRNFDNVGGNAPTISGTPNPGAVVETNGFGFTASATGFNSPSYYWTLFKTNETGKTIVTNATAVGYSFSGYLEEEGMYIVSVWVKSNKNTISPIAERVWTFDKTAPAWDQENALVGKPANGAVTNSTAFAFTASATDATAITYHWSLNGTNVTGVTDATFDDADAIAEGLAVVEGTNTVSVYATDVACHTNDSISCTWVVDTIAPELHEFTSTPDALTNVPEFTFEVAAEDATAITYHWSLNGTNVTGVTDATFDDADATAAGLVLIEGMNTVCVYATDEAGNVSTTNSYSWTYKAEPQSSDIEFGGGVCVKVDPITGTNSVSFTAVDFKPGEVSTFTLNGFAASTQGGEFQMWFVVCDTLGGTRRHVRVTFVKFESGELTVTLPASETTGRSMFFIIGIDNEDN